MSVHGDAAAAVFAQARAACKQSLSARPVVGHIGAASYMHTADRDSIVNLTAHDFSAYIICGRLDGRFVVFEQSVQESYERQVRVDQMRWHESWVKGGWIAPLVVAVGSMLLLAGH